VRWLGFLPEVLSGDSPDLRNAIAGQYERYGLAFSYCLKVRAIFFLLHYAVAVLRRCNFTPGYHIPLPQVLGRR